MWLYEVTTIAGPTELVIADSMESINNFVKFKHDPIKTWKWTRYSYQNLVKISVIGACDEEGNLV